jgi:hypothetical protein
MLRILKQPMKPLKPTTFDPLSAIGNAASMEIERRANGKHKCSVQQRKIPFHEQLLLRCTDANPDDVWF